VRVGRVYQCHALRAETTGFMVCGRRGGLEEMRDRWVGRRCGVGSGGGAEEMSVEVRWCVGKRYRVWALGWGVSGG